MNYAYAEQARGEQLNEKVEVGRPPSPTDEPQSSRHAHTKANDRNKIDWQRYGDFLYDVNCSVAINNPKMSTVPAATVQLCMQLCWNRPTCNYFVWNHYSKVCFYNTMKNRQTETFDRNFYCGAAQSRLPKQTQIDRNNTNHLYGIVVPYQRLVVSNKV